MRNTSVFRFRCLLAKLDWNHFLRRIDQIANQITLNRVQPWEVLNAAKIDNCTMQQFIDVELTNDQAKRAAIALVAINTCADPSRVSLLWFCWLVRGWGGSEHLIGMGATGNEQRVAGQGLQLLVEQLAREIDEVKLDQPVIGVDHTAQSVILRFNFSLLWARKVLFAVPISSLGRINFNPSLLPVQMASSNLPMGSCHKFIVRYRNNFWRRQHFSGHLITTCELGVVFTYDDSELTNKKYGITGFVVANGSKSLRTMSEKQRQETILEALSAATDDSNFKQAESFQIMDWANSPYIGGGHNSYGVPGFLTNERR